MNVKCPNCRFKFDVNSTDINEKDEVNCTCPRCGNTFTCHYIAPVIEHPSEMPVQQTYSSKTRVQPAIFQEQEADLYYAVMKRMKDGQYEEAGEYLSKLLELKPTEPIYINIKEQLDSIKQAYLLATKYIQSGDLDSAEPHINSLLQISPNDPMYLGLKGDFDEARRIKVEQLEEEKKRRDNAIKEEELQKRVDLKKRADVALKILQINLPMSDKLADVLGNLNESQLKETSKLIQEMPGYLKNYLNNQQDPFLAEWFNKTIAEKRQWIALYKTKLMPADVSRKIQENELYREANDHLLRGEFDKARGCLNKLLEMNPTDSRYQDLYKKLGSHAKNGSGCMVLILAVIISIASIIVL